MPDDFAKLKEKFLTDDLRDSLKWLIVGAVTWQAHPLEGDHDYLRALGMFTSLGHARALYEFFNNSGDGTPEVGETASARHFNSSWSSPSDPEALYSKYMAKRMPVNRRLSHLVYGRDTLAGGSMGGGRSELNARVLDFAKDLKRITQTFSTSLTGSPEQEKYGELVERALDKALVEGCELAARNHIPMPL
jgi:hypothetical protein